MIQKDGLSLIHAFMPMVLSHMEGSCVEYHSFGVICGWHLET
jgi:hypothetical protein